MPKLLWKGIVKVQQNVGGTDPAGTLVRINSKDNVILFHGPLDPQIKQWFPTSLKVPFDRRHKFFAYGELVDGMMVLIGKAPWQDW